MADKFFPIKTATACQLKWNWSTIRLYNGDTSSCHRVNGNLITVDTFDTFHNTPKKLADRALMLDGQWPQGGCEYCQQIEQAGGSSDRMFHTSIPNMAPPELDVNPTATEVTPTILEIYFDNICNMSCLYCWDGFSSKIQQENVKFGRFDQAGIVIENYAKKVDDISALTDRLWTWMETHGRKLKRFHVLGGEPFYQHQFDRCLEFFDSIPHPDLEFNVVSNLMISTARLEVLIGKIKNLVAKRKLKRFDLTVSIDCFGAEQEYVRYGLDLNQWRKNFEYVAGQKWITLNVNQTLSGLTIKTVPELLRYVNKFRTDREIGHYFSTTVMTHECLHPEIFGTGFFDNDFEKILNVMPDDTWQQKEARKYMLGIQGQLNSKQRDQHKIDQLGVLLNEIDRRRNLNWEETFPWLVKEIKNVV
jgi:organic radical activating enzyme